jgi:dynein heavy chain
VAPKKAKFEIAEAECNDTMALLGEKRFQLQTLETQLAKLHQKLKEANKRKQELEDDVTLCANKLMRAEKLIGKLSDLSFLDAYFIDRYYSEYNM